MHAWAVSPDHGKEFVDVTDQYGGQDDVAKAIQLFQSMLSKLFNCTIERKLIRLKQKKDCFELVRTPVLVGTPSALCKFWNRARLLKWAWGIRSISEKEVTYGTLCGKGAVAFGDGTSEQRYMLYLRGSHGRRTEIPLPMIVSCDLAERQLALIMQDRQSRTLQAAQCKKLSLLSDSCCDSAKLTWIGYVNFGQHANMFEYELSFQGKTKRVAVKELKDDAKQHLRTDFIELLKKHRHPTIVQTYGELCDGRKKEIFMEFADSGNLQEKILKSTPQLNLNESRHWVAQVLSGLKFLHKNELIHSDLKPANIVLTRAECHSAWKLRAMLSDFDGAVEFRESVRYTTSHYAAPEIAQFGMASPEQDLYSLGVTGCLLNNNVHFYVYPSPNIDYRITILNSISTRTQVILAELLEAAGGDGGATSLLQQGRALSHKFCTEDLGKRGTAESACQEKFFDGIDSGFLLNKCYMFMCTYAQHRLKMIMFTSNYFNKNPGLGPSGQPWSLLRLRYQQGAQTMNTSARTHSIATAIVR